MLKRLKYLMSKILSKTSFDMDFICSVELRGGIRCDKQCDRCKKLEEKVDKMIKKDDKNL